MTRLGTGTRKELTALLVAPDRELARQFSASVPAAHVFQVLADLKTYPSEHTLEIRLRQLRPDVLLLDVATEPDTAARLIRSAAGFRPAVHVVGLHNVNDPQAVLRTLRLGASEFLSAPFDAATQRAAAARICRLREPEQPGEQESGRVVLFSSAKPGSGASTLAAQTAFALRRLGGKRILLADFDLTGGTISFFLKLRHSYSLVDALEHAGCLDPSLWNSFTVSCGGLDVLPAPELPYTAPVDPGRLHDVLAYSRMLYDWVVVDSPAIFHRLSLLALSEADQAFLVSTSELPSLHLTRKAVNLLGLLGVDKERFRIVVNRTDKRDGIGGADMEKIFSCRVHARFPNDYFALHRVVAQGQPLGADSELGRAVEKLAGNLAAVTAERKRTADEPPLAAAPVLSVM